MQIWLLTFSGPKVSAFNKITAGGCVGNSYYMKHFHMRLLVLKKELDRLFNLLGKLGHSSPEEVGLSCKDCGAGILGSAGCVSLSRE